jgi:hypothetical protein
MIMAGVLFMAILWAANTGRAATPDIPAGTPARTQNPVTVQGVDLPAFAGVPLDELALYRYQDAAWAPVPFQFDEVTAGGIYTITEDGLLDGNDELVFVARDGGELVAAANWPDDATSRLHPRQVITVSDPLGSENLGWFYLYRSATLPRSSDAYIDWQEADQTLTGISYTLALETDEFFGISALTLNGQPIDLLDRQKLRAQTTIFLFGVPVSTTVYNEVSIAQFITQPLTVTLPIIGPVRAVGGNDTIGFAFYGTEADLSFSLPLADIDIAPFTVLHFDYLRLSLDLMDPAGTGFAPARYHDSNGSDVAIDGVGDAVPVSPPVNWTEMAGAYGGWVAVNDINPAAGTLTSYYLDDSNPDPDDTGDGVSFGDAGYRIDDPNGTVEVRQSLVILRAGTGNVGAAVSVWADNPLVVDTAIELFISVDLPEKVYIPQALKP